jgi:hypothetical protein
MDIGQVLPTIRGARGAGSALATQMPAGAGRGAKTVALLADAPAAAPLDELV